MEDKRQQHYTRRLTLRLSERLAAQLIDAAHSEDRRPGEYVRELIRRAVSPASTPWPTQHPGGGQ